MWKIKWKLVLDCITDHIMRKWKWNHVQRNLKIFEWKSEWCSWIIQTTAFTSLVARFAIKAVPNSTSWLVSPRSAFTATWELDMILCFLWKWKQASSNLTLFSPFVKVKVHSLAPGNYVSAISMIFIIVDFHLLYLSVTKTVQFKFAALSLFSDLFMLYTKPADTKFTSEHNAASLKYSISRTGKKNEWYITEPYVYLIYLGEI